MTEFVSGLVEIATIEGNKWIKDIKVGDLILTGKCRYKKVISVRQDKIINQNFPRKVFDISVLVENEKDEIVEEYLARIPYDHPIFFNGKFKPSFLIQKGDCVQCRKGLKGIVSEVIEIPKEIYNAYLYSIEVEDDHSYFASNILVSD